ncbi:MAG: MFS transporter [Chloroflexota bacterium]|nr:MFS transporter [Chloroflexota bacterium]
MLGFLRPSSTLTQQDVQDGLRLMVREGVAAMTMYSLTSGGFMAAYALALGANNFHIGVLAALPFFTQVMQLPAILLIERFRMRKALGIPCSFAAQLLWIPAGAVPFLLDTPGAPAVAAVIGLLALRGMFAPVWVTAWTSWMRDLVPHQILGDYYGRRLAAITIVVSVVSLAGSMFVLAWQTWAPAERETWAFSFLFIGGALTFGLAGPLFASRVKEPLMPAARQTEQSALAVLLEPLKDKNFAHLVRFLFFWSMAANLATPFFAVYMLTTIGVPLYAVIAFTVLGQISTVFFVRVWAPMADRMGSKPVLSLSASLYTLVILGWVFTTHPDRHFLTLPLLTLLHFFAGVAVAGATVTMSTLTLKSAPKDKATPFLGVAGAAASIGAGIGPVLGGLMADYFSIRTLRVDFNWESPSGVLELPAIALGSFDFLFVVAFVLSALSLNILVPLREEGEAPRDAALGMLAARVNPAARAVSSVPGLGMALTFFYGYLKRAPGADVALGVTAYQLAASTQAAVESASRGRVIAREIARVVGGALEAGILEMGVVAEHGAELARHATRGAAHAGGVAAGQLGRVTRGAALGTTRTLTRRGVPLTVALRGVGRGAVQGTIEAGGDLGEAVREAAAAARQAAADLGSPVGEAAAALASGALEAARNEGETALRAVRRALEAGMGVDDEPPPKR